MRCRLILAALCVTFAQTGAAQELLASHCVALADGGPERVERVALGDPLVENRVRIHYVDHATFVLETPGGLRVATDYTGFLGPGDVVPDVVTMNNAHDTHWTDSPDPRIAHVLRGWPVAGVAAVHDLDLGEMRVRNVPTDTRGPFGEGARRDGNSIFVFEVAGLCIGHLGHLHHEPSPEQYAALGRMDVVMVPVDGGYTMNLETMMQVVRRLRSSVVVPMHWFSGASLEVFLAGMAPGFDVVRLDGPEIEISRRDLPRQPTILVLQPAYLR